MRHLLLAILLFASPAIATSHASAPSTEIYFSPGGDIAKALVAHIDSEKKEILATTFSFSHREICDALARAAKRGVKVYFMVDPIAFKAGRDFDALANAGVQIAVWKPAKGKKQRYAPVMHNKFCVFGKKTVWTGSFNFTYNAAKKNCENAIVLHDAEIAKIYRDEFFRLFLQSKSYRSESKTKQAA